MDMVNFCDLNSILILHIINQIFRLYLKDTNKCDLSSQRFLSNKDNPLPLHYIPFLTIQTLYINVQMTYVECSRMSQIRDRNIYPQTDQLYQPLRNALRKLTVSQSLVLPESNYSRFSKTMRSLSPADVETLKKNLYIPVNKQLVPTRNIHKILGKRFTIVDVTERVRQALTPEQFASIRHGTTQEIIYEIKDEPVRNPSIYTSRETIINPVNISPHALRQSKVMRVNQNRSSQMNFVPQIKNRPSRTSFPVLPQLNRQSQMITTGNQHPNRQKQLNFLGQPFKKSIVNIPLQPNRHTSTNIYTQYPPPSSMHYQNSLHNNTNKRESLLFMDRSSNRVSSPLVGRHDSSKENTNKSMTSITALRNDANLNDAVFSTFRSSNENHSKLYDFRSSTLSDKIARNTRKSKEEYKYNLFSALDEPGNTNCQSGCCHTNEIIASKIEYNPWK